MKGITLAMRSARICLLSGGCLATALSFAQTPPAFTNHVDYDTWKMQFVNPQSTPLHPVDTTTAETNDNSRGGMATCDCWVTPDASYTTIDNSTQWNASGWGNGDDGSYGPVNLPFGFYLYGQTYNVAYININGNVSFGNYISTFSSSAFPTSGPSMVAPFWADVDLRGGSPGQNVVQYKVTPTALYVNWTRVGYYSMHNDKLNTFQVIITNGTDPIVPNGANVSFCYGTMQWTTGDASQGSNGFGGTPATVGANKGDGVNYIQFGRFDHAGTDYDGPFGGSDGIGWLTGKYFTFGTSQSTGNVPPVITGQSVCDSLTVCTDQLTQLSVDFLSPEPTQITTPSSVAATLPNYTIVSDTAGLNANIVTQFTPTVADTGYHDVYFYGTDNGNPVMTSTLHIVVHVLLSPQLISDSLLVCDNATPFNMLSVLGGNAPPGGSWTAPDGTAHDSLFLPGEDMNGGYTYSVGTGTSCAATGVATITNVPHAAAGHDTTLPYCSWDYPDPLFLHLNGGAQTGGSWYKPDGTTFNGTLDPATDASGVYRYMVPGSAPCPNDTAFLTISIPQAVHAGTDSSIVLCRDAAPFSMRHAGCHGDMDGRGRKRDARPLRPRHRNHRRVHLYRPGRAAMPRSACRAHHQPGRRAASWLGQLPRDLRQRRQYAAFPAAGRNAGCGRPLAHPAGFLVGRGNTGPQYGHFRQVPLYHPWPGYLCAPVGHGRGGRPDQPAARDLLYG